MTSVEDSIQVCIVTFDNADTIVACLESVRTVSEGLEVRTTLFDNGSSDGTVERVRSEFPEIDLLQSQRNIGFGAAQNRLLNDTDSRYALLLNPDAVLRSDCPRLLIESLLAHPTAAVAAPRVEYPDGAPQPSFGSFPSPIVDWRQRALVRGARRRDPRALRRLEARLARPFEPDWVSGACVMLETAAVHEVRGFDEGFHLYLEDVDLCLRLRKRGRTTRLEPRAVCMHEEGGSAIDDESRRRAYRDSRLRYERKHGTRLGAALYRRLRPGG